MSPRHPTLPLIAALALACLLGAGCSRPPTARTVILISIDTLRPERLGAYGNGPEVSPRIDQLAGRSVVFDQAVANSPWTLPSHMSMLTGLDPVAHGVWRANYTLSSRVTTLAEALQGLGFRTAAFTDGGFVSHVYGFDQGFEIYRDERDQQGGPNGFRRLLPEALSWLHRTAGEDRFLFLHTFDVHSPYQDGDESVRERFRQRPTPDGPDDHQLHRLGYFYQQRQQGIADYTRMSELLNDYDAGVHEADRGVGQVLDVLAETGSLDNALIIVTSDHGESFPDHGIHVGHGIGLTDDELRIPLVLHLPGGAHGGVRVPELVDLTDLMPTVLESMGAPIPGAVQGESLLGLIEGRGRRRDFSFGVSQNTESCFLIKDGYKFISPPSIVPMLAAMRHLGPTTPPAPGVWEQPGEEYTAGPKDAPVQLRYDVLGDPLGVRDAITDAAQLYERASDAGEQTDLFARQRDRADRMASLLKQIYEGSLALRQELSDGVSSQPVDPHVEQQLAALGYLAASDPDEERELLNELPRALREPLRQPWRAPDTTALVTVDQRVHALRLQIAEGRVPPERAWATIQDCGDDYMLWLADHTEHIPRVAWRVQALLDLAGRLGMEVEAQRWSKTLLEAQQKRLGDEPGQGNR
jgi:arylsulfatase A-like enzyme